MGGVAWKRGKTTVLESLGSQVSDDSILASKFLICEWEEWERKTSKILSIFYGQSTVKLETPQRTHS